MNAALEGALSLWEKGSLVELVGILEERKCLRGSGPEGEALGKEAEGMLFIGASAAQFEGIEKGEEVVWPVGEDPVDGSDVKGGKEIVTRSVMGE